MSTKYAGQVALNKLMQLVKNAIPTKVSQLTNDAGFITDADIPEGAAASTTAPLMDGTAAVGVSNAFARGDHVHPSDDSKLSLSGGTMTGSLDMGGHYVSKVGSFHVGASEQEGFYFTDASTRPDDPVASILGNFADDNVTLRGIQNPVSSNDAANKAYVDNMCQEVSMDFQNTVKKTGDTMLGDLNMGEKDIIDANEVSTNTLYLRPLASYPDGGVSVTAEKTIRDEESQEVVAQVVPFYGSYGDEPALLRNIYDPENNLDAANKRYVDGKAPLIVTALPAVGADHTYAEIEAAVSAGRGVIYHNEDTTNGKVIHAPLGFLLTASKYAVFLCRNGNVIDTTAIDENGSIVTKTSVLAISDEVDAKISSAIASAISGVYTPKGTVAFASLPTASAANLGWVYNISDAFTTTASFVEGAGYSYGAGTNVVCVDAGSGAYKWDVLAGTIDLTELTEAEVQTIWDSV